MKKYLLSLLILLAACSAESSPTGCHESELACEEHWATLVTTDSTKVVNFGLAKRGYRWAGPFFEETQQGVVTVFYTYWLECQSICN